MFNRQKFSDAVEATFDCQLHPAERADESHLEHADWSYLADVVGQVLSVLNVRICAISGAQGSGKSTLASYLVDAYAQRCINSGQPKLIQAVSLDDYYLTLDERLRLAKSTHPLLSTRGVPGTHDVEGILALLRQVNDLAGQPAVNESGVLNETVVPQIRIPRFDKGGDDRAGYQLCTIERLIFEGWCLGVQPQSMTQLQQPINTLEREHDAHGIWRQFVNLQIEQHYLAMWDYVGFWVHLRVPNFAKILEWRGHQEQNIAAPKRMSTAQIRQFIEYYERLTRWQWKTRPQGPGLIVHLADDHSVAQVEVVGG